MQRGVTHTTRLLSIHAAGLQGATRLLRSPAETTASAAAAAEPVAPPAARWRQLVLRSWQQPRGTSAHHQEGLATPSSSTTCWFHGGTLGPRPLLVLPGFLAGPSH